MRRAHAPTPLGRFHVQNRPLISPSCPRLTTPRLLTSSPIHFPLAGLARRFGLVETRVGGTSWGGLAGGQCLMRSLCSRMGRARGRMTAFGAGVVVFLKNLFWGIYFCSTFRLILRDMCAIQVSHKTTVRALPLPDKFQIRPSILYVQCHALLQHTSAQALPQ